MPPLIKKPRGIPGWQLGLVVGIGIIGGIYIWKPVFDEKVKAKKTDNWCLHLKRGPVLQAGSWLFSLGSWFQEFTTTPFIPLYQPASRKRETNLLQKPAEKEQRRKMSKNVLTGWKYAGFIGAIVGTIGFATYPIIIRYVSLLSFS